MQLKAPVHGAVIAIEVRPGQTVARGQTLLVQEAMKMEVPLVAPRAGTVVAVSVAVGEVVEEGVVLLQFAAQDEAQTPPTDSPIPGPTPPAPPASPRADLQALRHRLALIEDSSRPAAVAARHAAGRRTAREIVAGLADPGSFVELGALAVAAQRSRRPLEELQRETPADGVITGTATVDGRPVALLVYDYTVLAGTQGAFNHQKCDRLLELAGRQHLPLLLWAEGGGGRPGDVDWPVVAGLHCTTFARLAALSGRVPLIGMVGGRCFAGNAALLGCCDVVIAAEGSSIGMGGPAMIEGGGLGRVAADDVGPAGMHARVGSVDLLVADDAAVLASARRLLALWTQPHVSAEANVPGASAVTLRDAVPASRQAIFDPLAVLAAVVDGDSLVELRAGFGRSIVTAFARLGGQAVALVASQPRHLGGALDAEACDKLARFMQLAQARGLPLVHFIDTPGFMVGPRAEEAGLVRHAARVFVNAVALTVPVLGVVLRRGYGLGAMALAGGHFHAPVALAAWPGAEFGAMGIDGAVTLGYRKELAAAAARSEQERDALHQQLVARALDQGQAMNMASHLEIDAVIDPAETRDWLLRTLRAAASAGPDADATRRPRFIDPW